MDKTTGGYCENQMAHIRQSIHDILFTPIGSRIQRRDYGSYLLELIDRPISSALALQIAVASVIALKKWEPRIDVTRFAVQIDPQTAQIRADLEASRKDDKRKMSINDLMLGRHYE